MRKSLVASMLASATFLAVPGVALAQEKPAADDNSAEIIVTARRQNESLQSVPQVVNAVTGDQLGKLNIQKLDDIKTVVPGLDLNPSPLGYSQSITLRGVTYESFGGASPSVEFYLNDANVPPYLVLKSMYDIGQIEVLRGPQGTLRGRATPSGSITLTTYRPNLNETGGYVNATLTDLHGVNAHGAVGIPIIDGKVALRVAGLVDASRGDQTRSVLSLRAPSERTESGRATLRVEPNDSLSVNLTAQLLHRSSLAYQSVESIQLTQPNYPGLATPQTGPVINAFDRLGITDGPNSSVDETQKILNGQFDYKFAGQKLSYIGSRVVWDSTSATNQDTANVNVVSSSNVTPDTYQNVQTTYRGWTHEVRLSSDERLFNMLDYTVGYFYNNTSSANLVLNQISGNIDFLQKRKEESYFGNLTLHFGEATELSGGLRHLTFHSEDIATNTTANTLLLKNINGQPAAKGAPNYKYTIYNISLKHRFSDDLMVYANTGSSWRPGYTAVTPNLGIFSFTTFTFDPTPNGTAFTTLQPETSKSYEVGFKATFLDKKLRLNMTYFHQDFKNYLFSVAGINYFNGLSVVGRGGPFGSGIMAANVPAKVDGVEAELSYAPSKRFNIGLNFAWADGKMKNGKIGCNDYLNNSTGAVGGDGIPDIQPANLSDAAKVASILATGDVVKGCVVNQSIATQPKWSVSLQSEYNAPINDRVDGFIRTQMSYYPSYPNQPYNLQDDVKAYALVNLYLGVRSPDGNWELSVFGKNITNTKRVLSRGDSAISGSTTRTVGGVTYSNNAPYGLYTAVGLTRPQEFGLNLRYSFGSK